MCDSSSFADQNQCENTDNFHITNLSEISPQNDNDLNSIFANIFNNSTQTTEQFCDQFNDIIATLDATNHEDFDIYFTECGDLLSQAIGDTIGDLNVEIIETNETSTDVQPKSRQQLSVSGSEQTEDKENKGCKRKQSTEYSKSLVISKNPEPLNDSAYKPLLFFRGHSRKGIVHDSKTPIWDIKFKPKTDSREDLKIAATCGGHIINIINVECGAIVRRFVENNACEDFNCIAWVIFDVVLKSKLKTREISMIVTGGSRKEARKTFLWFINANNMNDFVKIAAHSNSINCLSFHPTKKNLLYSCSWDHNIFLWNIDSSEFTSVSKFPDLKITKLQEINCNNNRLLNIVVSLRYDAIIVAGESGLQLTRDMSTAAILNKLDNSKVSVRPVELPRISRSKLVDGLALIKDRDDLFAFRYRHNIFIANLDKMMAQMKNTSKGSISLEIVAELSYSDQLCDYFYFSIESRLIACGDASGRVLLYSIPDSLLNTMNYMKIEPNEMLEWPNVNNPLIDGKPVIDPKRPKFINIAAISADLTYIMCGTSNNLLCIWKNDSKTPDKCVKKRRLSLL